MRSVLDILMHRYGLTYIDHADLVVMEEVGTGGYGTVSVARCENRQSTQELVALKEFKDFNQIAESFIFEVRALCEYNDRV